MTLQEIVLAILGVANTIGGIMLTSWLKRQEDVERKLSEFQAEVPKTYVTKEDLEKDIDRLLHRFDKIELKIDRLIDSRKE